ncbi:MAG: hypothetical protein U1A27_03700 [Phycisphaerae bacterium]
MLPADAGGGDLKSVYDYDYVGRRTRKRVFHWDAGSSDWATTADGPVCL